MSKLMAIFPGQGSQVIGMGKDFYDNSDLAQDFFNRADKALGFSLSKLCFEGPAEELVKTEYVQPAILTVSVISYFETLKKFPDLKFDIAAGHSLGEYSALVASGVLDFEDAVTLVNKRGKFMQEAVPQGSGKMLAVLGKEVSEIEEITKDLPEVQIANINAPGQIVVSGSAKQIDEFVTKAAGWKVIPLQVSAPFHCNLMKPAAENLAKELAKINYGKMNIPVIANYTAEIYENNYADLLTKQVCGRVRWVETMDLAKNLGVDTVIEFGAGNVLTGLMKRINKEAKRLNVANSTELSGLTL